MKSAFFILGAWLVYRVGNEAAFEEVREAAGVEVDEAEGFETGTAWDLLREQREAAPNQ